MRKGLIFIIFFIVNVLYQPIPLSSDVRIPQQKIFHIILVNLQFCIRPIEASISFGIDAYRTTISKRIAGIIAFSSFIYKTIISKK